MIRGRGVARMATRKCVERRERTVTWGRRFVGSASAEAEGAACRSRRREFDDSAIEKKRQAVCERLTCGRSREAVGNCALRFADREVKAASRAQRGRSNAERLERATRDRTIESDGRWKQDADSPRGAGRSSAMPHSPARLRQRHAWRERPLLWPRA